MYRLMSCQGKTGRCMGRWNAAKLSVPKISSSV